MKDERGQIAVEMVIMMIVLTAITVKISSEFRQNEVIAQLVAGPWTNLDGMIQAGQWKPRDEALKKHPNLLLRHQTPEGDKVN